MEKNLDRVTCAGVIISVVISAVLIKVGGLTVENIVNIFSTFVKLSIMQTDGLSPIGSVSYVLNYFTFLILGIIFLVLSFSFLAAYGFYENKKNIKVILSAFSGLIFFFLLGFTVATAIFSIGVFLSSYAIIPLSYNFGKELKKWISFRVGSNTISRALLLFNLFAALAIFLAVLSNMPYYDSSFQKDFRSSISTLVYASVPAGLNDPAVQNQIESQIDKMMKSPIILSYVRWLPAIAAVSVWAILEIFRLFLPYLAGLFTSMLIKLEERFN